MADTMKQKSRQPLMLLKNLPHTYPPEGQTIYMWQSIYIDGCCQAKIQEKTEELQTFFINYLALLGRKKLTIFPIFLEFSLDNSRLYM